MVNSAKWRSMPLWSGALILLLMAPTTGGAIVLAPVGLLMTFIAARRTTAPRGIAFRLGTAINVILGIILVSTIATIVYEDYIATF